MNYIQFLEFPGWLSKVPTKIYLLELGMEGLDDLKVKDGWRSTGVSIE